MVQNQEGNILCDPCLGKRKELKDQGLPTSVIKCRREADGRQCRLVEWMMDPSEENEKYKCHPDNCGFCESQWETSCILVRMTLVDGWGTSFYYPGK